MKKVKLLTSLAAFVLVLGLGACDEVTEESTPDEGSETTETSESTPGGDKEASTLSNYTLSIGITYENVLVTVPDYATAYIEGGWDSWAEFVALTPSGDGRYDYTFASIAPGTYEYQLVLAYEGEEPGWTYRITQDGANASFTVKESDGDGYRNEVTLEALSAIDDIIPDPDAFLSNVKLTIDITYDGSSQEILDYGTLYIEGGWDSWAGFVACSIEEGKYVYTFDSLAPIEYEFLGVIYYTDETLPTETEGLWNYKVNGNENCKFTVSGTAVSAELKATKALSEILPEKGEEEDDDEGSIEGAFSGTYKLGALDEGNYCYRYFNGKASGNFLDTTDKWDEAVDVTIEVDQTALATLDDDEVTGIPYTLSFTDSGSTKYISWSDSTKVDIKEDPYTWYWVDSITCFVAGSVNGRVLVYYADSPSFRAYAQNDDNLKNPHVYPYTEAQVNPDKPEDTSGLELVTSLTDGGEYYWAYNDNGTYRYFDGKTTSTYYLEVTTDIDSAVLVKTTAVSGGWKLTFNNDASTIFIYPYTSQSSSDFEISSTGSSSKTGATSTWSWDTTYNIVTAEISTGTFYPEYYNNRICGNQYSYINSGDNVTPKLGVQFYSLKVA